MSSSVEQQSPILEDNPVPDDLADTVDYLTVDPPVPGQKFYCISFVSPENTLQTKTQYFMEEFWKWFKQQEIVDLESIDIWEQYKVFVLKEESTLEQKFYEANKFQTSIRGIKVRGVYDTEQEARIRCQVLQRIDKAHNVFVAPIGYWVPWDPSPDRIEDQVYQEKQLNELMKHYNENEKKRDAYYQQQKEDRTREAYEESAANKRGDGGEVPESDSALPTPTTLIDTLDTEESHHDMKSEFQKFTT